MGRSPKIYAPGGPGWRVAPGLVSVPTSGRSLQGCAGVRAVQAFSMRPRAAQGELRERRAARSAARFITRTLWNTQERAAFRSMLLACRETEEAALVSSMKTRSRSVSPMIRSVSLVIQRAFHGSDPSRAG